MLVFTQISFVSIVIILYYMWFYIAICGFHHFYVVFILIFVNLLWFCACYAFVTQLILQWELNVTIQPHLVKQRQATKSCFITTSWLVTSLLLKKPYYGRYAIVLCDFA